MQTKGGQRRQDSEREHEVGSKQRKGTMRRDENEPSHATSTAEEEENAGPRVFVDSSALRE